MSLHYALQASFGNSVKYKVYITVFLNVTPCSLYIFSDISVKSAAFTFGYTADWDNNDMATTGVTKLEDKS
jgi:hypothetical protein